MNYYKGSNTNPDNKMSEPTKPVLSEQELALIRETAQLTENLYVKMIYDKMAMEKILNLL